MHAFNIKQVIMNLANSGDPFAYTDLIYPLIPGFRNDGILCLFIYNPPYRPGASINISQTIRFFLFAFSLFYVFYILSFVVSMMSVMSNIYWTLTKRLGGFGVLINKK